jgi:murein DD-endopeptidase MepM/ murein hydrolase activator NlpD
MKRLLTKQFCIWLVSPQDGTVRKIRLSSGKILFATLLSFLLVGGFVFVAGDYTRVQILRARHYFNFKRLSTERGTLVSHNQDLRVQVKGLQQEKERVLHFERDVRQRLEELSNVLRSASELGIIPPNLQDGDNTTALGGAETDCSANPDTCDKSQSDPYVPSSFVANGDSSDLIGQLERSIEQMRLIPIGLPARGFISSPFGVRHSPFSGKLKKHQGVDFALPYGSSVFATADGVVLSVKRNSTYGLKIDIQHGSVVTTRYAHLSAAMVKAGDEVCRGQEIGLVGSSGRSTGPHLHYEVRVDGKTIDPQVLFGLSQRVQEFA